MERDEAARFSFLLSTPIIAGAGLLQARKLLGMPGLDASLLALLLGFVTASATGYVCIRFLLAYLKQRRLTVFAVYCWVVGLGWMAVTLT